MDRVPELDRLGPAGRVAPAQDNDVPRTSFELMLEAPLQPVDPHEAALRFLVRPTEAAHHMREGAAIGIEAVLRGAHVQERVPGRVHLDLADHLEGDVPLDRAQPAFPVAPEVLGGDYPLLAGQALLVEAALES